MTQLLTSSADHLLADLVEELSQKLAVGDSADVEAFLAEHADHAHKLRPLIPTLQVLAEMGSSPVAAGRSRAHLPEGNGHETNGHPVLGDFRILREVGRGGMGVVYEAEQISLRRRVALKVLPSAAMLDPRALQRFRNEAQAAAALHHSQIVPIFGVGCERGVHYYAMQFIDGLTLAEVITSLRHSSGLPPLYQPEPPVTGTAAKAEVGKPKAESSSGPAPSPQPPAPKSATETDVLAALSTEKSRTSPAWFRRIAEQFAQVADALHHAHELGVTHRDIKPANLMLDRLGHIWITDFGLARIEGEGNLTMTGDLVGTLRYMSPEQSLAKRIGIDHRTDIYSLGITLYELLTLHPALPGHGRLEILRQIGFEEPKPPRKHAAGIPRDLETIVLKMIEKNPAERYQTAGELAADLKRFVDDRYITARRPSLYVRASRWTKRRQGFVSATAIILLLAVAGGLGWMYDHSRRVGRATALVNEALQETALRRIEAQTKRDDLIAWEQASSSAKRAQALAESGPVPRGLEREVVEIAGNIEQGHSQARSRLQSADRDARMLNSLTTARLESVVSSRDGDIDFSKTHEAFQQAFLEYDIDLSKLNHDEIVRRIRESSIRENLVTALVHWGIRSTKVSQLKPDPGLVWKLAASAATESPAWHKPVIQALQSGELAELQTLAASPSANNWPPDGQDCLARALRDAKDSAAAIALFRAALRRNPGDFWLNENAGILFNSTQPPNTTEAIRFLTAAVAIRPDIAIARFSLAGALDNHGSYDESIAMLQEANRLQSKYAKAYVNLGVTLREQGKLEEAIAAFRTALKLTPNDEKAHFNLGLVLFDQGQPEAAVEACREAIRLKPNYVKAHSFLGETLAHLGNGEEAIAACREAIRLEPSSSEGYVGLGSVFRSQGKIDEAIAAHQEAVRITPSDWLAHSRLGHLLASKGKFAESLVEFREVIRLKPHSASAHSSLGIALTRLGRLDEAILSHREAIRLNNNNADMHAAYGETLLFNKQLDESIAAFRRAILLKPMQSEFHSNLGVVLGEKGLVSEAQVETREAIRLSRSNRLAHITLGKTLHDQGKLDEAIAAYREAIRLDSRDADAHFRLGEAYREKGMFSNAITAYEDAIKINPRDALAYNNLGATFALQQRSDDAIAAFRKAILVDPANAAQAHLNLGNLLNHANKLDEAATELREAIRVDPQNPICHRLLGDVLRRSGDFSEALAVVRLEHELGSKSPDLAPRLEKLERYVALDAELPRLLREGSGSVTPAKRLHVAEFLLAKKMATVAIQWYEHAFADDPLPAKDLGGHRYNAVCAALLTATTKGTEGDDQNEKERRRLTNQALVWLREDLAAWHELAKTAESNQLPRILEMLTHWRRDRDLISIRDEKQVQQLAAEDQEICRKLWADHAELVKRLKGMLSPAGK